MQRFCIFCSKGFAGSIAAMGSQRKGPRIFSLLSLLLCLSLTGAQQRRRKQPLRELHMAHGPSQDQIWDSGLIEKNVDYATIFQKGRQYYQETGLKKFQGQSLAYITPWHPRGYELAVLFRSKLTHVSPVWYQLRRAASHQRPGSSVFHLVGGHEVNQTWMREMRRPTPEGASVPKIIPRIVVELDSKELVDLVSSPQDTLESILQEVQLQGYDGVVLEVLGLCIGMGAFTDVNAAFRESAFMFIKRLSAMLHKDQKELVLPAPPVVPAASNRIFVELAHMKVLAPHVDGWSVMTYDYTNGPAPGPNAPLPWLQKNIDLLFSEGGLDRSIYGSKVWLGVNFYGYDFDKSTGRVQAITMTDYMDILEAKQPKLMAWAEEEAEHSFTYRIQGGTSEHVVYFPTARSLQMRLQLIQDSGLGASVWELGQGLEHFFDLF